MKDALLTQEIKEFVLGFVCEENLSEGGDWEILPPIELGILSWHLDSFYYDPLWWIEDTVPEELRSVPVLRLTLIQVGD